MKKERLARQPETTVRRVYAEWRGGKCAQTSRGLYTEADLTREDDEAWFDKWMSMCVFVCVCESVCASSGVTPLSQVSEKKKHMDVKQCSTVLFLRLKETEVF